MTETDHTTSTRPHAYRRRARPRLAAAHAAAERGWPVFPAHPYSKRPAITDWEHQASTDPQVLTDWWSRAPYNIAIACGPAGLVVVDLDVDHEPPDDRTVRGVRGGVDMLGVLAERHNAGLERTYSVATPSGGQHRYYLVPADRQLRNSAGALGWRIDIRAAGGYVIAAGSARRIDGRLRYYAVTDSTPLAELPDWIIEALTPPPPPAPPPFRSRLLHGARLEAWVRAAVSGETETVAHARPGTRNTTLFTAACRLGELVGAAVLDQHTATAALREAAAVHHGIDGFTTAEADRAITNGLTRGRATPRHITPDPG